MTNVVENQFDDSISEVLDASYQAKKLAAMSRVLSGLLSYLSHFIILAVAAFFVANKKFSAGKFFVAVSMIDQLSYPIISLSMYIKDLVSSKEALDKMISENGNNLSGGEKKRISLARVLLSDAPILILDEPLANVDGDTVSKIEDIIVEIEDKILFVVTHQFDEEKKKSFHKQVQLVH